VPPEINPLLRKLGLWDAFQSLSPTVSPGTVSVWGTDAPVEQDFVRNPHGNGWRVDRNVFDAMLLDAARRAGAIVLSGVKAGTPVRSSGAWMLGEVRAGFLIDATGRNGLGLPDRAERVVDDELLAVALRVSYPGGAPEDARTLVESTPGGWWYCGLLPNGGVMAMFFTDPETYRVEGVEVGDRLAMAPFTRDRLCGSRLDSSRVVYVPSSCRKTVVGERWAAVGDAASAYDPLSGRGIFKALRHGAALASACASGADGLADYASMVRVEFEAYARQRREYYGGERRWPESGFWTRRTL